MRYQQPFYTNWAKGEVISEIWIHKVWTCEMNPKQWSHNEKNNQSSDRLSWIMTFSKKMYVTFRRQNCPFYCLDLCHEANKNSNFRSFSMWHGNLKNNTMYQSTSGCAKPKVAPDLLGAWLAYFSRVWKISATFSTKKRCQNWKKMVMKFLILDLGWMLN